MNIEEDYFKTIYEDSHFYVVHYVPKICIRRELLVIFSDLSFTPRSEDDFWGKRLATSLKVETVGIVSKFKNFYPVILFKECLDFLKHKFTVSLNQKNILLYGSSMGGGAALRYAAPLKANYVVAFAPIYSVSPSFCGENDTRFLEHFNPKFHQDDLEFPYIKDTSQKLILFDTKHHNDKIHYNKYKEILSNTKYINLDYCSHSCVTVFSSTEKMTHLFDNFFSGKLSQQSVKLIIRNSPIYYCQIANSLIAKSHFKIAESVLNTAIRRGKYNGDTFYVLAKCYPMRNVNKGHALARSLVMWGSNPPRGIINAMKTYIERNNDKTILNLLNSDLIKLIEVA
jgi:hypothetical protein